MSAPLIAALARLHRHLARHASLLVNAGALAAGTLGAAVLGFAYWWFAARAFPPAAVGLAAAAISLMNLIAHAGEVGMGPLLMSELPRLRGSGAAVASAALATALVVSGGLGAATIVLADALSLDLGIIAASPWAKALFVAGCALTGFTIVLDQAFVGLLAGGAQMIRTMVFAGAKLGLLVAVAVAVVGAANEAGILGTWIVGQLVSVAAVAFVLARKGRRILHRPRPSLLRPLMGQVIGHHALSIVIQAPGLALPFIVAVTLSAEINAAFYAAWTLVNVVLLVPASLSAVIVSVGMREPALLAARLRISIGLSTLAGLGAGGMFLLFSPLILGLFSPAYPDIAGQSLQWLGFGTLGFVVKYHYVAVQRLRRRLARASIILAVGGAAEIAAAVLGAQAGGLLGLTQAWLAAVLVESLVMLPNLACAARYGLPLEVPADAAQVEPTTTPRDEADDVIRRLPRRPASSLVPEPYHRRRFNARS